MKLKLFTFNPFQENTYLLFDESSEAVIVDPGCYDAEEKKEIFAFIKSEKLNPVRLLNTHCHIDHVLGNKFIYDSFGLVPEIHPFEVPLLKAVTQYGTNYGIFAEPSPEPLTTLDENKTIKFGTTTLKMIFAPGHSPGSICFYDEAGKILIGGDVLFQMSIGRTDLPGGDMDTLLKNIREKLFTLPGDVVVYPGHGPSTTIGFEKLNNPFLHAYS